MKKFIVGFICGSIFFSAISYAVTANLVATISDFKIFIESDEVALNNKPVNIDGSTYLPLREMSNLVGYDVRFDDGKIYLTDKMPPSPPVPEPEYRKLGIYGKLLHESEYYGLAIGGVIYIDSNENIYYVFDPYAIDLLVSVASKDYKIVETHNANPDYISADHHTEYLKYVDVIEREREFKVKNLSNQREYEVILDKENSKGVIYLDEEISDIYIIPINEMLAKLGLRLEARYEKDQKRVVLSFK